MIAENTQYNLNWDFDSDDDNRQTDFLDHWLIEQNSNSLMLTKVYMYRDLLISKEKAEIICNGKQPLQYNHKTVGGHFYEESVNDDVDGLLNDLKLGKLPKLFTWTFWIPEITLNDHNLIENKDKEYFNTFKWSSNPDVDEAEMKLSTSKSKYVSSYCRRKTVKITNPIHQMQQINRTQRNRIEFLLKENKTLKKNYKLLSRQNELLNEENQSLYEENESLRQNTVHY